MKIFFKLLISATLLFLVFRYVHFKDVSNLIFSYTPQVLIEVIVLQFLALAVATLKWQVFLQEHSFKKLFRFTLVGQFYSLILPGQLFGEMAKAYRFSKGKERGGRLIASVAMDKITGIAGLLLVAVVGMVCTKTELLGNWKIVIVATLAAVIAVIFSFRFESVRSLVMKYLPFRRTLAPFINAYHEYAKDTILIVRAVSLGVSFQLLAVWVTMILAHSLSVNISLFDWFWIFSIVSVAVFVPITIGGIGVREGIFVGLLGFFAVPPAEAVVLSLSVFALQVLTGTVGGAFEAWHLLGSRDKIEIRTK